MVSEKLNSRMLKLVKKKEKSDKDCKRLFGTKRETRMLQSSVQGMPWIIIIIKGDRRRQYTY